DQIPHPVSQLARLAARADPSAKVSKADKKRTELLDSFDLLACHLHTTFDILSRSLAKIQATNATVHGQAQMMLVVGSTIASARSRVIVDFDGFEVKPYGRGPHAEDAQHDEDEDDEVDSEDDDDEDVYYEDDLPPLVTEDQEADESSDEDGDTLFPQEEDEPAVLAEEERLCMVAERALSRTINSTDSFCSELAPTNTYILLRAPRSFVHPSWTAQPRYQKTLDVHLAQRKEGVRVTTASTNGCDERDDDAGDENDELIWWMWDGKLVGFAHQ
ncbi:hypothetical protein EXIGLDRAFT_773828, partial [Exidia glandulosa HHB12029]